MYLSIFHCNQASACLEIFINFMVMIKTHSKFLLNQIFEIHLQNDWQSLKNMEQMWWHYGGDFCFGGNFWLESWEKFFLPTFSRVSKYQKHNSSRQEYDCQNSPFCPSLKLPKADRLHALLGTDWVNLAAGGLSVIAWLRLLHALLRHACLCVLMFGREVCAFACLKVSACLSAAQNVHRTTCRALVQLSDAK